MDREVILTEEGYLRLKEEIEYLSTSKRREVAERIKEAREFGDIAENSEYDDAKNEQAQLEYRIQSLEQKLRNARVVDTEHVSTDTVSIGAKVTLRDTKSRKTREYSIVGSAEADPKNHRLSNESPVGKALLGQQEGREGHDPGAARRARVPDRQDPGGRPRLIPSPRPAGRAGGGLPALIAERRAKAEALRRRGIDPFPPRFPGRVEIAAARAAGEGSARRDRGRAGAGRRPPGRAPGSGEDGLPRPRGPQRAHPALGDGRPHRRRRHGGPRRPRPRRHRRRRPVRSRAPAAASSAWPWTRRSCSPRPCARRPDKHAGVRDPEIRHRQRYLDLMADPRRARRFLTRARRSRRSAASSTSAASWRSRRRRSSRSTAGRPPAPS